MLRTVAVARTLTSARLGRRGAGAAARRRLRTGATGATGTLVVRPRSEVFGFDTFGGQLTGFDAARAFAAACTPAVAHTDAGLPPSSEQMAALM